MMGTCGPSGVVTKSLVHCGCSSDKKRDRVQGLKAAACLGRPSRDDMPLFTL